MSSLTIAWEYLTGYAVASDPTTRDRVEWPPHPARVFMALAAAWFETEPEQSGNERAQWDAESEALRWLEGRGDPEMILPAIDRSSERSGVTSFVPVNDRAGPARSALQSCPAITRDRKPRAFPRMWVGHEPVFMRWPAAEGVERHHDALDRLCRKVTRIGHSSSLVAMWVAADWNASSNERLCPVREGDSLATIQARSLTVGTLAMLIERFGEEPRRLDEEIKALEDRKNALKGKWAKEAKIELDAQIQMLRGRLADRIPRDPVRPTVGLWTGYRRANPPTGETPHSHFDPDILILSHAAGPRLPLTATRAVAKALRDTIMSAGPQPVPEWVSGHQPDGRPSADETGHLAIVPLPFVGSEHADGHLLGVGLVFPRSLALRERGRALGGLLIDEQRQAKEVRLKLGRLGDWVVRKRDWDEPRQALAPEPWTAASSGNGTGPGSRFWASVTPVVLDRFPKSDRGLPNERSDWAAEVAAIVTKACARIGLPEPERVDIDTTSWHLGCPRAVAKLRPVRGHGDHAHRPAAPFGDGFPPYPARGANAPRPQVHVWLQFPEPVIGPVLLGAGRYLGYGFCKPWRPRRP